MLKASDGYSIHDNLMLLLTQSKKISLNGFVKGSVNIRRTFQVQIAVPKILVLDLNLQIS